jgi:arylsulfatase A-like enzyme
MDRREFLKTSSASLLAMTATVRAKEASSPDKPNILIIMTDQQFADGMSCVMGKKYLNTPHMDSLAANGVRFTRAYSPNPLCMPMRTSMISGLYPHQTGVQTNNGGSINSDDTPTMGTLFQNAGYRTGYFGKWHIRLKGDKGFDNFTDKPAQANTSGIVRFLKQEHDRPFLAVASFLGPHEICQWARKERIPGSPLDKVPPLEQRPPMRKNSTPPKNETDIMAHMRKSYQAHRLFPVGNYTEDDWQRQIWGYFRLIERVDGLVGEVMQALRESGQEENTVVVFLSDHGDCHGAHRWNQKTVFYDESARVPFIISHKGKIQRGTSDLLLNTGLDLIPTICDFAGIKRPESLTGISMKSPTLGRTPDTKREYVVSQNHMVQCEPVDGRHLTPHGRMVRSKRYKYCLYSEGERRESLVDMEQDPGEMVNQAGNPDFRKSLDQHREYLGTFAKKHKDTKALEMLNHLKTHEMPNK